MRFRSLLLTSLAVPAMLAMPAAAHNQPAAAAQPTTIQGNIAVCEAARGEHRVRMERGQRYTITATSDSFDTFLRLLRPGVEAPLAEDDDGGGGLNSRINHTATESGDYLVRVSSFAPGGVGSYQLRVDPAQPLRPAVSRPTRTERSQVRLYEGALTTSDAAEEGRHFDDYEVQLGANQAAMIHLDGQGTDVLLRVYRADARGGQPLMENDDGGGGLNSFLFFAPETPGTYVVRATTFGEGGTGPYRLRISEQAYVPPRDVPVVSPPAPQPAPGGTPQTQSR